MLNMNPLEWIGALLVCIIVGSIFSAFVDWLSYEKDDE